MNYIVMDLEWNQSPRGKEYENKKIPFEVIEIGAVKVNEKCRVVSEFSRLIKPQVYKELHYKTKEIIEISMQELKKGDDFVTVMREFLIWCGDEYIFCTWGSTDLIELQRNMKYFNVENTFKKPLFFYDIQKFFSILYDDGKLRRALQYAIEQLNIGENQEFHRAINDARYTAIVMANIDFDHVKSNYSIDCYDIPTTRREEIHAIFEKYEKYISKGFETREAAITDREVRASRCFMCGKSCKKHIKWFSTNTKVYYGLFSCEEHGMMKGRIRTKQADNGKYYAVRIMKITNEDGADKIRQKQQNERMKRRLKRKSE